MEKTKLPTKLPQSGLIAGMVDYVIRAINDVDEKVVLDRVAKVRAARPQAPPEELCAILIRQKCLQAGAVGAVTAGTSLVPGGGTIITLTFGVAADLSLTLKMQAELVLEIAAVYQRRLRRSEKRQAILLVTGMSVAGDQVMTKAGAVIAKRATERLASASVEKALPVISVAASAGKNILTTYIVGQRAQAYFSLGPEAVDDWRESFTAISGVDAQHVVTWLAETTERSWHLMADGAQNVTAATIVAGQSASEVVVVQAGRASQQFARVGRDAVDKARTTGELALNVGRNIGESAAAGAKVAGWVAEDTGQSVTKRVKGAAGQAATTTQKMVTSLPYPKAARLADRTEQEIIAISNLPNQSDRLNRITAGCQNFQEACEAFELYMGTNSRLPFAAIWRDADEPGHAEPVTISGVAGVDPRRGVLLAATRGGRVQRRLLAEQVWADDRENLNALLLDDYRRWLQALYAPFEA